MIPSIHSKLPAVGTTIFTVMSGLAAEHNAVNLGQGFPDYDMDSELVGLVNKAMKDGYNQYVPMQGYLPLREAIAEKVHALYGASIDAGSDITITPGGTYAIYTALTTVLRPGDEVIVFEPAYDSYIPNIEVNGATAIRLPLRYPDYSIDWQMVRNAITDRTRVIMINSPHNPTGAVLRASDLEELRKIVSNTNIFILSDEVYEHLVFDGIPHESVLRYPDLMERSFVCFSFGKVYHCTGWKLGYCISNASLMTEFRKVHQYNCFSVHSPSQVALAGFLSNRESYLGLGTYLQEKRDYFTTLMKQTRFDLLSSHGSYFICGTYNRISDEGDSAFAKRLTIEHKVATIPVSAFYKDATDNKVIRFCFAKKRETLESAVEKLARL
ncbi:MAG: aminotransferase class I/II-fold pyridoxal phosphate-dependent enzyme [Chitinophagaceae bacterium]|nr:MAG: aminotransferase class I/II-fold pyridoxal phosphate-dependent enzyme [Chitinophagaceae bacterium]